MYQLTHVINTVLTLANEQGITVNPEKLNALLYKIYMQYLMRTGDRLFATGFQASARGPVLACMDSESYKHQVRPIKCLLKDEDGAIDSVNLSDDSELENICNGVLNKWGSKDATWVMESNARDGSAWKRARIRRAAYLNDGDILLEAGSCRFIKISDTNLR